MNIKLILNISQIVVSVVLMAAVLLQARGTGLGGVFGGEGMVFGAKRGIEKILFKATIVLSVIFLGLSLGNLFI
jgi:preprotein translocase subunit SecG